MNGCWLLLVSAIAPGCILDDITSSATEDVTDSLALFNSSPDQLRADKLLSKPKLSWAGGLPAEHLPSEAELGFALVYLAGLRQSADSGVVPDAFIAARLPTEMATLTERYPSTFGQGRVRSTGFPLFPLASPDDDCNAPCLTDASLTSAADSLQLCLASKDSLERLAAAWRGPRLSPLWHEFEAAYEGGTGEVNTAIEAAARGQTGELSVALSQGLVEGATDPAVARSVAQVYAIEAAFQCSHTTNALVDYLSSCAEWRASSCGDLSPL